MAKEGSTISGLMDTIATMTSVSLQYGVPLRDLVNKFAHVRFEPAGFTGNPEIPIAKSIVDYVFRWMGSRFLPARRPGGPRTDRVTPRWHGITSRLSPSSPAPVVVPAPASCAGVDVPSGDEPLRTRAQPPHAVPSLAAASPLPAAP